MENRKMIMGIAVVVIVIGLVGGYFLVTGDEGGEEEGGGTAEGIVQLYTWWTAGGEANALNAARNIAKEKEDITVVKNEVPTGGGAACMATVKQLYAAGNPPDTTQLLFGKGLTYSWHERLKPIDDVWEDYEDTIPDPIEELGMYDGHHYLMPMNIHTYNNLWYNKEVVQKAGVDMPLESFDEFLAALKKVKNNTNAYPLAFGTNWKGWYTQLWSSILSREDTEFLRDFFVDGTVDVAESEEVTAALEDYAKIFKNDLVNTNYSSLTWDEGGDLLIEGDAAFNSMGDWQNGHFLAVLGTDPQANMEKTKEDKIYGRQWFPGATTILQHGDSFGVLKGAPHPEATRTWLEVMKDKETQVEFCIRKGATPPRPDTSTEKFGPLQKDVISDFRGEMPLVSSPGGGPSGMRDGLGSALSYLAANPNKVEEAQSRLADEYNALEFP